MGRHNTPERNAEKARIRRTGRRIAAGAIGAVFIVLFLTPTAPVVWFGVTTDLTDTPGTVISSRTKTTNGLPTRPDSTQCIAVASYQVAKKVYTVDVTSGCPDKGESIVVQYDADDPNRARTRPTWRLWFEFILGAGGCLLVLAAIFASVPTSRKDAHTGSLMPEVQRDPRP